MKVFAFLCATAIAVSTQMVQADDITCAAKSCVSSTPVAIAKDAVQKIKSPTCTVSTEKAYVTGFDIKGASGDTFTVTTVAADGTTAIAEADDCKLTPAAATFKTTESPDCGKDSNKGALVSLTCAAAGSGGSCAAEYTITYKCATPDDVAVACGNNLECKQDSLSIPKGKKAIYTAPTCATEGQKAYLSKIAVTGADGDKLTFTTKSDGTALTDTCVDATAKASLTAGDPTALTCGKGLDTAITVEVACTRDDTADCAPTANTLTFVCAAKTGAETPAPSTGSMLTKANAIVGVISGMVGAIVYFNRG